MAIITKETSLSSKYIESEQKHELIYSIRMPCNSYLATSLPELSRGTRECTFFGKKGRLDFVLSLPRKSSVLNRLLCTIQKEGITICRSPLTFLLLISAHWITEPPQATPTFQSAK